MPKKAFVSYAHESAEHKNQVLALATLLRQNGVEAVLDVWAAEARIDWYAWAIKEMTEADYIVVVASEKYLRVADGTPSPEHRGVQSEAALLRDLVWDDRGIWLPKILPVLLPGRQIKEIPRFLQPSTATRYEVNAFTQQGIEDLLRVILGQPSHIAPPVGEPPVLPARSDGRIAPVRWTPLRAPADVRWWPEIISSELSPGTVELHLVPAGNTSLCSEPRLQGLPPELADHGRRRGIFSAADHLDIGSADSAGGVLSAHAGIAALQSGQRSAWFRPASRRRPAADLSTCIQLLLDIDLEAPHSWAPAVGMGNDWLEASESVAHEDLRRMPDAVAAELAARLIATIREPEPPAERREPRTTNIHNRLSGNVSGTVIQVGQLFGADPPTL